MRSVLNLVVFNIEVGINITARRCQRSGNYRACTQQIADEPITLHGAGRTDAGVHATNMVAHLTLCDSSRAWMDHGSK